MSSVTAGWVRTAHADAWQVLGTAAVQELPGARLMATGLPHPQWNSGDVDDPVLVDVERVRRWYAEVGVPWGLRLPAGAHWPHGRRVLTQRMMGVTAATYRAAAPPPGTVVGAAAADDLPAIVGVDTVAFEQPAELERPWLELLLAHPAATVAVVEVEGVPVACGDVVMSSGRAGPAAYVGGIAVLPEARRRGIGAAVSSWLVQRGLDAGARLAHLHPDTEHAAGIYRRLGFVEVDGVDIYVDN